MRRLRGSGFARLVAGFEVLGPGCPPGGLVAVAVVGAVVAAEVVVVVVAAAAAAVVVVVVVVVAVVVVEAACCSGCCRLRLVVQRHLHCLDIASRSVVASCATRVSPSRTAPCPRSPCRCTSASPLPTPPTTCCQASSPPRQG